jgi:hypothetical protein
MDLAEADVVPVAGDDGRAGEGPGLSTIQGKGHRTAGRGVGKDELGADRDPVALVAQLTLAVLAFFHARWVGKETAWAKHGLPPLIILD